MIGLGIFESLNVVQRVVILSKNITLRAADIDLPSAKMECGTSPPFRRQRSVSIRTILSSCSNTTKEYQPRGKDAQKNRLCPLGTDANTTYLQN